MLISDMRVVGNRMYEFRKKTGCTQAELAEKAGISDRAYAEIERGTVNMRVETLLQICSALNVSPNDLLIEEKNSYEINKEEILEKMKQIPPQKQLAILRMINAFLDSGI